MNKLYETIVYHAEAPEDGKTVRPKWTVFNWNFFLLKSMQKTSISKTFVTLRADYTNAGGIGIFNFLVINMYKNTCVFLIVIEWRTSQEM